MSGLLVIDGTGLLVRGQLTPAARADSSGDLALFFFIRSVIRFVNYHDPEYILVAWDGPGGKNWRRQLYPPYKANRHHADPERIDESNLEYRAASFCFRTGIFGMRGSFEADDIIAWATRRAEQEDISPVHIRSDDADMNQLVSPSVFQYPLSGDSPLVTQGSVIVKYGCAPHQLPLLRALAGDSSDNIPGVPGIGIKTAAKILSQSGYNLSLTDHPRLDEKARAQARVFEEIMDLRGIRDRVDTWLPEYFSLRSESRFDRDSAREPARTCFEVWGMKSLVKAADEGRLW